MQLSVVMACCNGGRDFVIQTIESITSTAPEAEIIIVDDNSTDGSCVELPKHVNLIRSETRLGCSRARSIGLAAATGDILIVSDPHCLFSDNGIKGLAKHATKSMGIFQPPVLIGSRNRHTKGGRAAVVNSGFKVLRAWNPIGSFMLGSIYAMNKATYSKICEGSPDDMFPSLPCWFGSYEPFITTIVYRLGMSVSLASVERCTHMKYRRRVPFTLPDDHQIVNRHYYFASCLPKTYSNVLRDKLFQIDSNVDPEPYLRTEAFLHLRNWLDRVASCSEDEFFDRVGINDERHDLWRLN